MKALAPLIIILCAVALPSSLSAETTDEELSLSNCDEKTGVERSVCRSLQLLKLEGEAIPTLDSKGRCKRQQQLTSNQRQFCKLTGSMLRNKRVRTVSDRVRQKARSVQPIQRFSTRASARQQERQHLLRNQLRKGVIRAKNVRKVQLERQKRSRHRKILRRTNAPMHNAALPRVINIYRPESFQFGKLRYHRTRPSFRKPESIR